MCKSPSDTCANHTRRCRRDNGSVVWFIAKLETKVLVESALRLGIGQGRAGPASNLCKSVTCGFRERIRWLGSIR